MQYQIIRAIHAKTGAVIPLDQDSTNAILRYLGHRTPTKFEPDVFYETVRRLRYDNARIEYRPDAKTVEILTPCLSHGNASRPTEGRRSPKPYLRNIASTSRAWHANAKSVKRAEEVQRLSEGRTSVSFAELDSSNRSAGTKAPASSISPDSTGKSHKKSEGRLGAVLSAVILASQLHMFSDKVCWGASFRRARNVFAMVELGAGATAEKSVVDVREPNPLGALESLMEQPPGSRYRAGGFLLGLVESIDGQEVVVESKGQEARLQCCCAVGIPGNRHTKGPYIFLGLVRKVDGRSMIVDARARPVASVDFPIPVESEYERKVALELLKLFQEAKGQVQIVKPQLFEEIDEKWLIVDFLIYSGNATPWRIEVLGFANEKYLADKAAVSDHVKAVTRRPVVSIMAYKWKGGGARASNSDLLGVLGKLRRELGLYRDGEQTLFPGFES